MVPREERAGAAGARTQIPPAVSFVLRAALRADEVREERKHEEKLSAVSFQLNEELGLGLKAESCGLKALKAGLCQKETTQYTNIARPLRP
jgi:hypothetical protein